MGYNYEIHYKHGKENIVVDARSRIQEPKDEETSQSASFTTISSLSFPLFSQLQYFYSTYPAGQALIAKIQVDSEMRQKFRFKFELLYFKERIFVPKKAGLVE